MYVLEYLIYHLRPFGIRNDLSGTAPPPPDYALMATPWSGPKENEELENQKNNDTRTNSQEENEIVNK